MKQIYIDMDGVVADFDAAIVKLFGEEGLERNADKFWKRTCVEKEAFFHMEPIWEGVEMVLALQAARVPICFLTSTGGMPHHNQIARQKLAWLYKFELGEQPVAFCMNTVGKGRYASDLAILVDDREKVLAEWRKQGGIGILFTRQKAADIAQSLIRDANTAAA
jgi:5'(3')-deoxyribonucleotidase